jgi:hypothetical protein
MVMGMWGLAEDATPPAASQEQLLKRILDLELRVKLLESERKSFAVPRPQSLPNDQADFHPPRTILIPGRGD